MLFKDFAPAAEVLDRLHGGGYEAYLVGGCVRDMLMKKEIGDFDVTTNAEPSEVLNVFSAFKTYNTGIKHGTVTVVINNVQFEITTFRKEAGYSDNRHPDNVSFCKSLCDDLSRRDFTVNAIAYSFQNGFVDLFGGFNDISAHVIRCIGSAEARFNEDALRILRALRFSSVTGFEIESETANAIHKCRELLNNVSKERISAELSKMLCGNNIRNVLTEFIDVFEVILPELSAMKGFDQHNFHHKYDVLEHTAAVVESTKPVLHLRLAALFHDCSKPDCFTLDENGIGHFYSHASLSRDKAVCALKRLRFDNVTANKVKTLVKLHDSPIDESENVIKKKLNKYGEEMLKDLIELQKADTMGLADQFRCRLPHFEKLTKMIDKIIKDEQCFSIKNLDINGNDIMALGYEDRQIGKALQFLLDSVIDNKTENQIDKLCKFLTDNFTCDDF